MWYACYHAQIGVYLFYVNIQSMNKMIEKCILPKILLLVKGPVYRISLAARMSIILSHSEVLLGQNHSVWDSMMLILAATEILHTGLLSSR